MSWDEAERAALIALLRTRPGNLAWAQITDQVAETGSARIVWDRSMSDLFDGHDREAALADAERDIAGWRREDFGFHTFLDDGYPARLRDVHQMPPVLFTRGTLVPDDVGVSVVGSRRASEASLRFASETATRLVDMDVTVLSGLAEGIDTAAHRAALDRGGRTVAVIGTGISRVYPASNRELQGVIADRGLVLSQFWPMASPSKISFPMRNATMSAYGHATIVVEAGEQSGARIQARLAVEHGRPVILTAEVVRATRWGGSLVGQPGVLVAGDPAEATALVEKLLTSSRDVASLLAPTGT